MKVIHIEASPEAALPIERSTLAAVGAELTSIGATRPDEIMAAAQEADLLLTESTAITRSILAGLPRCQAVVCYAIGLDHVDLQAATDYGIIIAHTPGFCIEEVSNHTLMFILACARRLAPLDRALRQGWWPDERNLEGALLPMGSLHGEQLGLISFGSIAQRVATKAQAFGLQVSAYDPYVEAAIFSQYGIKAVALESLLESSDYLSIHTPLSSATRHLIGSAQLRRMKPTAFLINTSRGAIIDEAALIEALQEGWLAGAALDVFDHEPLPPDSPLLALENVIVTPHTAFCSNAAYIQVRRQAAEEAARILKGQWPVALANPGVKGRSRMEQNQH